MKIYKALRRIDHGLSDGKVVKYAPGDEVPEQLAEALPNLVEAIEMPGVVRAAEKQAEPKPPADPNAPKPLSRMNVEALQGRAIPLGIDIKNEDGSLKSRGDLIKEIQAKEAGGGSQE